MICEKEHRYDPQYNDLPVVQGGEGRHRCAGCAYERGYEDGLKRVVFHRVCPDPVLWGGAGGASVPVMFFVAVQGLYC